MGENSEKNFLELVDQYRRERGWKPSKVEAMKAVIKKYPDAHRRYIDEANAGR